MQVGSVPFAVRFVSPGTIAYDRTHFVLLDREVGVQQSQIDGDEAGETISSSDKLPSEAFDKGKKPIEGVIL